MRKRRVTLFILFYREEIWREAVLEIWVQAQRFLSIQQSENGYCDYKSKFTKTHHMLLKHLVLKDVNYQVINNNSKFNEYFNSKMYLACS